MEKQPGNLLQKINYPDDLRKLEEKDLPQVCRELRDFIIDVVSKTGRAEITSDPQGVDGTDMIITLKPRDQWTTAHTKEELVDKMREALDQLPGTALNVTQPIQDLVDELVSGVKASVAIKIFGNDIPKLQDLSRQVAESVKTVEGAADVFDGIVIAGPSVSIEPDNNKLSQFGVTPAGLQLQLQSRLEGNIAGNILEREQLTNIRMVYPNSRYATVADIQQMQVFLPSGKLKPITELANVKVNTGDAEINRENLQSMGEVTARLENRDLGSVMKDIQKKVASDIVLPQGYHIEYGGSYAEQQQSFKELLTILITSSLLVFSVILFLFRDLKVSMLIILLAVLGIAGSYIALYITKTPLNVGSYTGLIMIVGIIGENAIFTFLQFRESLHHMNVDDSIVFSISTRLRPKLMTALGAIIALMPLALGIGTGAQLHQPLAIAVIGGFVAALPILLIVLPSMLRILYRHHRVKDELQSV